VKFIDANKLTITWSAFPGTLAPICLPERLRLRNQGGGMTAPDLSAIIARLRRAQPRNLDTMTALDALEAAFREIAELEKQLRASKAQTLHLQIDAERFDRSAYQREYMRDARAAKKLGISTAQYRRRDT
jgi:hypothetical protein